MDLTTVPQRSLTLDSARELAKAALEKSFQSVKKTVDSVKL